MRSYDEYCSLAKALDLVGDRWTLLVVRELSLRGPSRYTDLRNGLPGVATNLLEDAPPPVATTLFKLTPRGEGLRPVLDQLMLWGLPLMVEQKESDAVRSHWLAGAIELMLRAAAPDAGPVTLELRIGDEPIAVVARDGVVKATLGPASEPDAVVSGPPPTLYHVAMLHSPLWLSPPSVYAPGVPACEVGRPLS